MSVQQPKSLMINVTDDTQTYPWEQNYPQDIKWRSEIAPKPLFEMFDESVERFKDKTCVDFLDKELTYGEIGEYVNKAAKGLQNLGVKKGTKVGLFLPNTPYNIIFYYAVLKIGGTIVNFNPLYVEREIEDQVVDSETEVMVTLDMKALYDKIGPMVGSTCLKKIIVCKMSTMLPLAKSMVFWALKHNEIADYEKDEGHVLFDDIIDNDGEFHKAEIDPYTDVAVLQYTGGTTGIPKGAMLTHACLDANTTQCRMWCVGMEEGAERMLAILPVFHVFAMTAVMNTALKIGACIIMVPRFELSSLLKLIDSKKPTIFPAVPTIYTAISNAKSVDKYDLSSLKLCISGGAPLPVHVKHNFEEKTGCKLIEGYGLSETAPLATANPFFGKNKEGSIGIPVPGTIVEVRDMDDPTKTVKLGERGEVCIKGPQVMAGYWKKDEETANVFVGDFLRTGDGGHMDEEGYIFLGDRIKDLIICSGYNVYPRVVEEAIYQHDAIAEATVIGIPDDYRGQSVKAFAVLKENETLEAKELLDFLKDKLSPIEMPKTVEFRKELPKTLIGKLSKKELVQEEREKYEARQKAKSKDDSKEDQVEE